MQISQSELQTRWQKIQQKIKAEQADGCLISTNVNLLYALGRVINGYAYLPAEGDALVFIRRPEGFSENNYFYISRLEQAVDILKEKGIAPPQKLLVESGEMTHEDWLRVQKALQAQEMRNATTLLRQVRSIKTPYEIEQVRESARLQSLAYTQIPTLYRSGMTDHEFSVEIERNARLLGNLGIFRIFGQSMEIFMGSVLAGENAAAPSPYDFALGGAGMSSVLPIGHSGKPLQQGNSVMVDVNGNYTGYISDLTRTFSIGKLPKEAYFAHDVAIEIQNRLAEMGKAGAVCEDLYLESLRIADRHGLSNCFMGLSQKAKFVGHGIGLVINELPVLANKAKDVLQENMTIAVEPKFIINGVGAVGVEDTFIVHKNGMERITSSPQEIIDLEK
jgi:Xaa-Pro aminopeptidase